MGLNGTQAFLKLRWKEKCNMFMKMWNLFALGMRKKCTFFLAAVCLRMQLFKLGGDLLLSKFKETGELEYCFLLLGTQEDSLSHDRKDYISKCGPRIICIRIPPRAC